MDQIVIYPIGTTLACHCAREICRKQGLALLDHPAPEVTHLLLDIPSFRPDGSLRSGESLEAILQMLPEQITVIGGNLQHPALQGYRTWDLLQDEAYLADNAAITAHCALGVAFPHMRATYADTGILILGWGRIGKCLGKLLAGLGAACTVAARNPKDLAMIRALGFRAVPMDDLSRVLPQAGLIFNTVPSPVLGSDQLSRVPDCVAIDLASSPGIEGANVIPAKGLPGIHAPLSSGRLIADTILHFIKEDSP